MKKVKKLVSLLLAAVMVMAMSVTAFAEEDEPATTYTITIKNEKAGHTYEAYQIFAGDLHTDDEGNKVLSNIVWGKGVDSTTLLGKLVNIPNGPYTNTMTAAEVAEKLGESGADAKAFAAAAAEHLSTGNGAKTDFTYDASNKKYTATVEAGYYLIKDKDESMDGKHDAYTDFILQVVGAVEVAPKSAWPTVDKQVKDETTDAETGATEGWGETADHAINESFQFKLTAKIPDDENIGAYKTYKLVFHDTMSKGVTFEKIDSVKIGTTVLNEKGTDDETGDYTLTTNVTTDGTTMTLTIDDLLSVSGVTSIKNQTVEVLYSAHLNENAVIGNATNAGDNNKNNVYLEYSNNPNSETMGKTADDNVWVFTYEMKNTKVDGSNNNAPLAGAGFKLYDSQGTEIGLIYDTTLSAYRPVKATGETAVEMKSATDGTFNIVGLDADTYTLKETTTPSGYNTCKDVTIVISANHSEAETGDSATTTITMMQDGTTSTTNEIVNKKGTILPSTGGIGTTIFYLCGGILVVFAAVALITKKRMKSER